MFVLNENEQDIPFITVDYWSVPLSLFIFYTNGIYLTERDKIEWYRDFLKSHPVLLNGTGMAQNSISLMFRPVACILNILRS